MTTRKRRNWKAAVYQAGPSYDKAAWAKLRAECLRRDRHTCFRCGRRNVPDLTAHHIQPRADGGPDTLANLITLCDPCHDYVELAEFRCLSAIADDYNAGSDTDDIRYTPDRGIVDREESFDRHVWEPWVYGGIRGMREWRARYRVAIRREQAERRVYGCWNLLPQALD